MFYILLMCYSNYYFNTSYNKQLVVVTTDCFNSNFKREKLPVWYYSYLYE